MRYKIGDFYIEWFSNAFKMENDEFMKKFETAQWADEKNVIKYCMKSMKAEEITQYKLLKYSSSSELYETSRGKMIIYHWATCRFAIGYWMEDLDKEEIICYVNSDMEKQIPVNASWFFSISGLHRALLKRNAPVLHASYIEWREKAILFSAPSQTGKSTQARLWEESQGARIINDDRVLLRKTENEWKAYGYPSCGSSKICINQTLPICAIVILEQGEVNQIQEMSFLEKVRAIASGIEVYIWNLDEIEMAFQCAQMLAKEVTVLKLVCRPDYDAVSVLKEYLSEGGK